MSCSSVRARPGTRGHAANSRRRTEIEDRRREPGSSATRPTSSSTSRTAACRGVSPGSMRPPGPLIFPAPRSTLLPDEQHGRLARAARRTEDVAGSTGLPVVPVDRRPHERGTIVERGTRRSVVRSELSSSGASCPCGSRSRPGAPAESDAGRRPSRRRSCRPGRACRWRGWLPRARGARVARA